MLTKLITIISYWFKRIVAVWKRPKDTQSTITTSFKQWPEPEMVTANRELRRKVKQQYGVTLKHKITKEEKRHWINQLIIDKRKNQRRS